MKINNTELTTIKWLKELKRQENFKSTIQIKQKYNNEILTAR